jgi:hypothetical protein
LDILLLLEECLLIVLNTSYVTVDYDTYPVFAKECLPHLLRMLEAMKSLFNLASVEKID